MSFITASGITYAYGNQVVLRDVSLSIEQASIVALVGPNGAGKTTLMRCLAGLEWPLGGQVETNGQSPKQGARAYHRLVGYLQDRFGLYQDLSVERILKHQAAIHRLEEASSRIEEVLEILQLTDYRKSKAKELSRGWKQRVGIAQAILHRPEFLILDEPASGLDPEARSKLSSILKDLQSKGMTILVSSHILAELEDYAERMLILESGRLVEVGDTTQTSLKRLKIVLLEETAGFLQRLEREPLLSQIVQVAPKVVTCSFAGGEQEQAALLSSLISEGHPLLRFEERERNLQQSYLDSLANERQRQGVSA